MHTSPQKNLAALKRNAWLSHGGLSVRDLWKNGNMLSFILSQYVLVGTKKNPAV